MHFAKYYAKNNYVINARVLPFANRSHARYEFTSTKTFVKKLARIEASSICYQQIGNVFAECFVSFIWVMMTNGCLIEVKNISSWQRYTAQARILLLFLFEAFYL